MAIEVIPPPSVAGSQIRLGDMCLQSSENVDIRGGRVVRLREFSTEKADVTTLIAKAITITAMATIVGLTGYVKADSAGVLTASTTIPASDVTGAFGASGVTFAATDRVLGRQSPGGGLGEEITCTAYARSLMDDADAATARATLELGATNTVRFGKVEVDDASFYLDSDINGEYVNFDAGDYLRYSRGSNEYGFFIGGGQKHTLSATQVYFGPTISFSVETTTKWLYLTEAGGVSIGGPLSINNSTLVTNLNADLLDGYHAASFALLSGATFAGTVRVAKLEIDDANFALDLVSSRPTITLDAGGDEYRYDRSLDRHEWHVAGTKRVHLTGTEFYAGPSTNFAVEVGLNALYVNSATGTQIVGPLSINNSTLVTNLNADMLDGYHGSQSATANTAAIRDASGNLNIVSLAASGVVQPGNLANWYLGLSSSQPIINFDSNDYFLYDRTNNEHEFYIGGTLQAAVNAYTAAFRGHSGGITQRSANIAASGSASFNVGYTGLVLLRDNSTGGGAVIWYAAYNAPIIVTQSGGSAYGLVTGANQWWIENNPSGTLKVTNQYGVEHAIQVMILAVQSDSAVTFAGV